MYAYLKGKLVFKSAAQVYLDVNNIGYDVSISLNTYTAIQHLEECKLFTYLQVKEDSHTLYGFFEKAEKDMFVMLISVAGVGASTARMMLSSLRADEVAAAIAAGNVSLLERVKGIGKKTAERLVLELKDKAGAGREAGSQNWEKGINTPGKDAVNALIALGIAPKQAEQAVSRIVSAEPDITRLEDLIKKALKAI